MFVDEIIKKMDELKAEGKIKDFDFFDTEKEAFQEGFVWVDEIDKWVKTD